MKRRNHFGDQGTIEFKDNSSISLATFESLALNAQDFSVEEPKHYIGPFIKNKREDSPFKEKDNYGHNKKITQYDVYNGQLAEAAGYKKDSSDENPSFAKGLLKKALLTEEGKISPTKAGILSLLAWLLL